jgi:hypothetical protein
MDYSEILRKTELAITTPFKIVDVTRVSTITHNDPEEKFAGEKMKLGEYGIVELRLIVPLAEI